MADIFKKFLYTGVGLVSLTAEKIQEYVNKLVDENKISVEEGRKIVDDFVKNTRTKKAEFETQLKSITERVVKNLDFATQHQLDDLKKRVQALEKEMKSAAPKSSPRVKKTASTT